MDKFISLIIPSQKSDTKDKGTALNSLLFSPILNSVKRAVRQNSIKDIYLAENSDYSIDDNGLKEEKALTNQLEDEVSAIFVVSGETPLVTSKDIMNSLILHKSSGQRVTLLSTFSGSISGAGWYNPDVLRDILKSVPKNYALSDVLSELLETDIKYAIFSVDDKAILTGDTPKNRAVMAEALRKRITDYHLLKGVEIQVSSGVVIGPDVEIGKGTQILQGTTLVGKTKIGENCIIGPNSDIRDSVIDNDCVIDSSKIESSVVGASAKIGPMSHLRPNSTLGKKVKVGNFVEIKNSSIDDGTSVSHLTYIGDSDVGKSCNFGCGVVTVNYDGKNKHRTKVGNNAFIGCNCNLIAPVSLGDKVYAAAGTTITDDVPPDSLVIGRAKQEIKKDWCKTNKLFDK